MLHSYYSINKLKINPDQTHFLICASKIIQINLKNLTLQAKNYVIKQSNVIKILGSYIRKDLKLDTEIGNIASNLHYKINQLRNIQHLTNFNTRLAFLNATVIGKLNYLLPLYLHGTKENILKLHKIIMASARLAIGHYGCKLNITKILDKCKWLKIESMMVMASLKFIHKITLSQKPKVIANKFKNIKNKRKVCELIPLYIPRLKNFKKFYLIKATKIYNKLPQHFKTMSKNMFKKSIKTWIKSAVWDTYD